MEKEGIIAAVVLLLITGCAGGGEGVPPPGAGYVGGSEGLVINFVPNYPPPQVYDDQPFDAVIEIRNRGTHNVGPATGTVYLSGFDPAIIPGIPTTGMRLPEMEGASQFNPEGTYDTVQFKSAFRDLGRRGIDKYTAPLQATVCYQYLTIGSENVCLDPDLRSLIERKVCTPGGVSFGAQGAPIAVTSVDVDAAPGTTRFRIGISNVGGGIAFKPGGITLQKCSPYSPNRLEYDEINHVMVRRVEVAGRQITGTCKPQTPYLRLDPSGHAELFCTLSGIGAGAAYMTPMTVELEYGYKSSVIRSMDVISSP